MEKINLQENLSKGMTHKEVIDKFFSQLYTCNSWDYKYKDKNESKEDYDKRWLASKLNKIYVEHQMTLPVGERLDVYAVCSQEEIDKLISFGGDYVSYNRRMKVIDDVPYCNTMKFVTYHIDYIEDGEENLWRPFIHFVIVKQWQGAEQALQVILAEKKLADAKYALGSSCSHITF